jgi:hypothetical protein
LSFVSCFVLLAHGFGFLSIHLLRRTNTGVWDIFAICAEFHLAATWQRFVLGF